jgi:hypothetical protein
MDEERLVVRVRPGAGAEGLARTLKRLAPNLCCPSCGHRDFALIEEPAYGYRSQVERRAVAQSFQSAAAMPLKKIDAWRDGAPILHTVASLVCTTCGLVQHYSDGVLSEHAAPDAWGVDVETMEP